MKKVYVIGIILLLVGINVSGSYIKDTKEVSTVSFNGNTLYVGGSGPNNYTTIQSAINDSVDGDTVFVYDDSSPYYENLVIIQKSICLIGEDRDTTIIDGMEYGDFYVEYGTINISGFTLQSTAQEQGVFMYLSRSNSNIVSGNIILGSIHIYRSDHNTISNNIITLTDANYDGIGLYLHDSNYNIITDNVFFNSGLSFRYANPFHQNIVSNNTVNGKPLVYYEEESDIIIDDAGQVILIKCDNITVQNQAFSNVCAAVQLAETDNCLFSGNTISNSKMGFYLQYSSYNNISGNIISDYHIAGIFLIHDCEENIISYNYLANSVESGIKIFHQSNFNNIYMNIIDNSENNIINDGVDVLGSNNNNFSRNTIISFFVAFSVGDSYNNTFYMNEIINCTHGFSMYSMNNTGYERTDRAANNHVLKNNLKRVLFKGFSRFITSLKTNWDGNYWGRGRILPKPLIGFKIISGIPIPSQIEFDWRPAQEPYDIPRVAI